MMLRKPGERMRKILFLLLASLMVSTTSFAASGLYMRVDDNGEIIDIASNDKNLSSTYDGIGSVYFVEKPGSVMIGDHFSSGQITQDSPRRAQQTAELQARDATKTSLKMKLKALGLTDEELALLNLTD